MASGNFSFKRLQINRANSTIMILLSLSAFLTVGSIIASRALLSQRSYQARVIAQKKKANAALETNIKNVDTLVASYNEFIKPTTNIIGGNSAATGDRNGDNAKIILDALPSKYDFPALASSLEKILTSNSFVVNSITGTDDELNQVKAAAAASSAAVEIPFQLSVKGSYDSIKSLIDVLERSIRPINVQTISISGTQKELQVSVNAKTYYQPEKKIEVKSVIIK